MPLAESFRAASQRLECALGPVALVVNGLPLKQSFGCLSTLQAIVKKDGRVIRGVLDRLAAVSDGPVKWAHGRGRSGIARCPGAIYPHVWSSAHEAVLEIVDLALDLFYSPLEGILDAKEQKATFQKLLSKRRRQALAMTIDERAELQERIRRERAKLLALPGFADNGTGAGAPGEPQAAEPAPILTSWREILIALGYKHNEEDKQKVARLNKTYGGPITIPGQGKQPLADKTALLDWWNGLTAKAQTEQDRQRDARATVSAQYDFGRNGGAVPDISGGVKKRRRDRQP